MLAPLRFTRSTARGLVVMAALLALLVGTGTLVERVLPGGAGAGWEASGPGEAGTCDGVPVSAPRQLRGMWLTTVENIDFPSRPGLSEAAVKAEYLGWLDVAQELNLNAIFVHVRPSGDAFWPSDYAPWSQWLTGALDGRDPGWDPMQFMVDEAHQRNLEFHAWVNPYRGGQPATSGGPGDDFSKLAPNHPLRQHPEWAVVHPVGKSNARFYFNPGIPQAREWVVDSIIEAVELYDIDGIHFDDFFYPSESDGKFDDDAAFATYGQDFSSKAAWRRENVNLMVRETYERIKAIKPWVRFGISPSGIWRNRSTDPKGSDTQGFQHYDALFADSRRWVREGWLDYIAPQVYWNIGFEIADYAKLVPWWSKVVEGTEVQLYIGQADYRIGEGGAWRDSAEMAHHLAFNEDYPVLGNIHFSAKSLKRDKLGAVTRYRDAYYSTPALMPTLARLRAAGPATPAEVQASRDAGEAVRVSWSPRGSDTTTYAVYRLDPDASRALLVGTRRASGAGEQSFTDAGAADGARYCVSGLDRAWNESRVSVATSAL